MKVIEVAEFITTVSEVMANVVGGEDIAIARNGSIIARIIPSDEEQARANRQRNADEARAFRAKLTREGNASTVDEIIAFKNEGRR